MRNEARKEIWGRVLSQGSGQDFKCQVDLSHLYRVENGEPLIGFEEGTSVAHGPDGMGQTHRRAGLGTGRLFKKL